MLVAANPFSASYLEVKRKRMQHDLPSGIYNAKITAPSNGNGESGGPPDRSPAH
jgi:hypothetical protein